MDKDRETDAEQNADSGGARIDDGELVNDAPPLPGEGHGDPLTEDEPSDLEEQVDPDTGFPMRGETYR